MMKFACFAASSTTKSATEATGVPAGASLSMMTPAPNDLAIVALALGLERPR